MWIDFEVCNVCGWWFPDCEDYKWTSEYFLICQNCCEEHWLTDDDKDEDWALKKELYEVIETISYELKIKK